MPEPQKIKSEKKPQARGFNPEAMAQAQALNQQPDSIPAMMKPGEYVLPPDTVAAMGGPGALDATVAQTHTPANAGAIVPKGFEPRLFFNNGGLAQEEETKQVPTAAPAAPAPASAQTPRAQFVADQNQKLAAANTQLAERTAQLNERYKPAPNSPTNTFPANRMPVENGQPQQAPTAPAVTSGFASAQDGMTNDFGRQPSSPTPMASAAPSTAPKTPASDPQSRINEQMANAQRQRAEGIAAVQRGQAYDSITQQQRQQAYDTWQSTRQPGILPQPRSDMRQQEAEKAYSDTLAGRTGAAAPERTLEQLGKQLGGLDRQHAQNVQLQAAARTPEQARAEATQQSTVQQVPGLSGVYKHGEGQYSDNAQGMGFAPGRTGQPSAQNMQAANALASQQQAQSMGRIAMQQQAQQQMQQPRGFAAPQIDHSGNSSASKDELRRLRWAAESAMANAPRKKYAMQDPAVMAYQAALKGDTDARYGGQAALEAKTNDTNAGLQREQMQQQGANQRDAGRLAIDQQRLGLDTQQQQEQSTARGFEIRGAQRREGILQQFDAAKTDQERAQLQQRYPDVFGKGDSPWKVSVTPATKNIDGSTSMGSVIRYNDQTGQVEEVKLNGVAQPQVGDTRDGYRYKGGNPNDKASWQKL